MHPRSKKLTPNIVYFFGSYFGPFFADEARVAPQTRFAYASIFCLNAATSPYSVFGLDDGRGAFGEYIARRS